MAPVGLSNQLFVVSSRGPQRQLVLPCVKPTTIVYNYNYETFTLDDILVGIHQQLQGRKVSAVGFLLHSLETEMFLCFAENRILSESSSSYDVAVRAFFQHIVQSHLVATGGRIDFLNSCLSPLSASTIAGHLGAILKIPIGIWKDYLGDDNKIGSLYFNISILQNKLKGIAAVEEKLDGYEKIRTVGKGAFGTANLYKKKANNVMVVIKEINMVELTANERQMALNEAQVLSVLDHPNIVSYHRSFEQDGVLMIEMEYADGGNLAQLLTRLTRPMPEKDILSMFYQIAAAINHMHSHNILHRDLKTANVFLTKENVIKVGDFGISKTMTTKVQGAQTVLGTPYYISPEMCEGKQYDQKSDIWAIGCILYEMACLKKPFLGSSLPALVNNIMKGNFQQVPSYYSPIFKQIVNRILQRDPHQRPSAADLLNMIPLALDFLNKREKDNVSDFQESLMRRSSKERSVLYEVTGFDTSLALTTVELPNPVRVKQIAVSNTHYVLLTSELTVLTWGEGTRGQLGHGDTPSWRPTPAPVLALGDRSVRMVAAGDGFSVFVSDSGMLMTCGDGSFGCLGHSDWNNLGKPKLIEKLLQVDVSMVSCGPRHVAVLSSEGEIYTWGQGDGGRLGLGHERDSSTPTAIVIPDTVTLRNIYCGVDSTMAISSTGALWACGRNSYNKLGFNTSRFFPPGEMIVEKSLIFRRVGSVTEAIREVSLGPAHTCLLTEDEYVITMGRNSEGQLGHTSNKSYAGPKMVANVLSNIIVTSVVAGPTYTAVTTLENVIMMWGTRYSQGNRPSTSSTLSRSTQNLNASSMTSRLEEQILREPKEILALYASPQQLNKGNMLVLDRLYALPTSLLALVHTTAPLPKRVANFNSSGTSFFTPATQAAVVRDGDTDSLGPVPDWIKAEAEDSQAPWAGFSTSNIASVFNDK